MEIHILRHGEPEGISADKIGASDLPEWLNEFDAAGIKAQSLPPASILQCVNGSNVVVSSSLQRSMESARLIIGEHNVRVEPSLIEFPLPSLDLPYLLLSPGKWVAVLRLLWVMGYSRNCESFRKARARASMGADYLARLASESKSVAFVGHGMLNFFIARELKKKGWKGPAFSNQKYWGISTYSK